MLTHIKVPGSYNQPLCGWDRKNPQTTTVCTTGVPDCQDCLAMPTPPREPFAMRRDKTCPDCEAGPRIRGVDWVRLCRLHGAAPDLLDEVKATHYRYPDSDGPLAAHREQVPDCKTCNLIDGLEGK